MVAKSEIKHDFLFVNDIRLNQPRDGQGFPHPLVTAVDPNGNLAPINLDASGNLKTTTAINASEITIGAVELKDDSTNIRVNVEDDGGKNAVYVQSNSLATENTLNDVKTTLNQLHFDASGNLYVTSQETAQDEVIAFSNRPTVAGNSIFTLLSYTNTGKDLWVDKIVAQGNIEAEYSIYINTVEIIPYRTTGSQLTMDMSFPTPLKINPGQTVDIKVLHWFNKPADFKVSLIGHKF